MKLSGRVRPTWLIGRLLWGIPVLLAVVMVTFVVLRFTPGGPFDREKPLPEAVERNLRQQYKLDRPLLPVWTRADESDRQRELDTFADDYGALELGPVHVAAPSGWPETQFFAYLGQVMRGDLGVSMKFTQLTVNDILARTFPVSFTLGLLAFLLAYAAGMLLGVLAAANRDTWIDGGTMVLATLGFSVPSFVLGALAILVFALWAGVLPPALWEGPSYAVLPVITLAAGPAAYIARLTRSGLLDTMQEDFIRTARAKGLSERVVMLRHGLANALGPLVTVSGPLLASLVTGSFVVEHIFSIPGMGRYFITAVTDRDYPLVMGVTIVYATLIVVANILVDLLYAVIDPRVEP